VQNISAIQKYLGVALQSVQNISAIQKYLGVSLQSVQNISAIQKYLGVALQSQNLSYGTCLSKASKQCIVMVYAQILFIFSGTICGHERLKF